MCIREHGAASTKARRAISGSTKSCIASIEVARALWNRPGSFSTCGFRAEQECGEILDAVGLAIFRHAVDLDVKRTDRCCCLRVSMTQHLSISRQTHLG